MRLEQMIRESDVFVAVLSDASVSSQECAREFKIASSFGKRIIPLNHVLTSDAAVPGALAALHRIEAQPGRDIAKVAQELCEAHDTDIKRLRLHTRLLNRAAEWNAGVRGSVLRGDALAEAERFLVVEGTDPQATDLQRAFVAASRKAATRRRQVVGLVTAAVLVIFAVVGWFARNQQLASQCNELLGQAQAAIESDPAAARKHALAAAAQCKDDLRAKLDRLVAKLLISPRPVDRVGPVGGNSVVLSADGRLLAVGPKRTALLRGSTQGLQIWNLEDRTLIATIEEFNAPPASLLETENSLFVVDTLGRLGVWGKNENQLVASLELTPELSKRMLDGNRMIDVAPADRGGGSVIRIWDKGDGPLEQKFGTGASGETVIDPRFEFQLTLAGDKVRLE